MGEEMILLHEKREIKVVRSFLLIVDAKIKALRA